MPRTEVRLYQTYDGKVPLLDWLDKLQNKVRIKCVAAITRLEQLGFKLHVTSRNEAACLGNGIYELRIRRQHVNYRILYFFYKQEAVVISHGLQKERRVPEKEIDLALRRKDAYEKNPTKHTHLE